MSAAAQAFAQTAIESLSKGVVDSFATSQAQAFGEAKSRGTVESYATAVAQAIVQGGDAATNAYASAFAKASAAGGDEQQGLVEAIAVVSCQGGASAEAFAEALSISIGQDKNGCTVLTQARASAYGVGPMVLLLLPVLRLQGRCWGCAGCLCSL